MTILIVYSIQIAAVIPSTASVQTSTGIRSLDEVRVGEDVLSVNEDSTRLARAAVIVNNPAGRRNSTIEIYLANNKIKACADQLFFNPIQNQWVKAEDIDDTTMLLDEDLTPVEVLGVRRKSGVPLMARLLAVGRTHTLFVDGVLVHNMLQAALDFAGNIIWGVGLKMTVDKANDVRTGVRDYINENGVPQGNLSIAMAGSENEHAPLVGGARGMDARGRAEQVLMAPAHAQYVEPRVKEPSARQAYYESKSESEKRFKQQMAEYNSSKQSAYRNADGSVLEPFNHAPEKHQCYNCVDCRAKERDALSAHREAPSKSDLVGNKEIKSIEDTGGKGKLYYVPAPGGAPIEEPKSVLRPNLEAHRVIQSRLADAMPKGMESVWQDVPRKDNGISFKASKRD